MSYVDPMHSDGSLLPVPTSLDGIEIDRPHIVESPRQISDDVFDLRKIDICILLRLQLHPQSFVERERVRRERAKIHMITSLHMLGCDVGPAQAKLIMQQGWLQLYPLETTLNDGAATSPK